MDKSSKICEKAVPKQKMEAKGSEKEPRGALWAARVHFRCQKGSASEFVGCQLGIKIRKNPEKYNQKVVRKSTSKKREVII